MLVIALALGVLFGWLLEKVLGVWTSTWTRIAAYEKSIVLLRFTWWCFWFLAFLGALYLFAGAHYDADTSYLPSPITRTLHFITAPKQLVSILGFILGWSCYAGRARIRDFAAGLSGIFAAKNSASAQSEAKRAGAGGTN